MRARDHINAIHQAKALNDPNSSTLAHTLETFIQTAFNGNSSFEMLQNADDALAKHVQFLFIPAKDPNSPHAGHLIFSHSGKHFSETDVEKISDNAQKKHRDKSEDQTKTGFKGVGFKSIYKISRKVIIWSNEYRFRFDKDYPQWQNTDPERKYPWPIIPIWTEEHEIDAELKRYINPAHVNFIISVNKGAEVQQELEFLANNPTIMLFLRHVSSININTGRGPDIILHLNKDNPQAYQLSKNNSLISSWTIKHHQLRITDATRASLLTLSEYECPDRLKTAETVSLCFAAQISPQDKIIPIDGAALSSFLPTKAKSGLKYLINGDFLLNADRTGLLENPWNTGLLRFIGRAHIAWLAELTQQANLRDQILKLLPHSPTHTLTNIQKQAYVEAYNQAVREIAFIPQHNSAELLTAGNALIDTTKFYKLINIKPPATTRKLVDYALEDLDILTRATGTETLGILELCDHLPEQATRYKTIQFQEILLRFFTDFFEKNKHARFFADATRKLGQTKFLLSASEQLETPASLYFERAEAISIPALLNINFVHPELPQAEANKKLLQQLGSKNLDPREIIKKLIELIQQDSSAREKKININNIIPISRFLLSAAQASLLAPNDWQNLSTHLPVLTNKNSLKSAKSTYLSDQYHPRLSLEKLLAPKDLCVSERYLDDEQANTPHWKAFFTQLGVQADITFENKTCYTMEKGWAELGASFNNYVGYLSRQGMTAKDIQSVHYFDSFLYCNVFEYLSDGGPDLAKVFWKKLIDNLSFIQSHSTSRYIMRRGGHDINISYIMFQLQTKPCVPDHRGQLRKTAELYSSRFKDFSNILPVANLDFELTEEQAEFFGFKTSLTLDECLKLLDELNQKNHTAPTKNLAHYPWIFKAILELDLTSADKNKLARWRGLLPAQNGSLQEKSALRCLAIKDKSPPASSANWLREFSQDMTQEELVQISQLFGITIIDASQLKFKPVDVQETPTIKNLFRQKLQVLARIEAHTKSISEETTLRDILARWNLLKFFSAHRMTLSYSNSENDGQAVYAHIDRNHQFYFAKQWDNNRTISEFCKEMSRHLNLSEKAAGLLQQILQEPDHSLNEWLEEQGFATEALEPSPPDADIASLSAQLATTTITAQASNEASTALQETSFQYLPPTPQQAQRPSEASPSTKAPRAMEAPEDDVIKTTVTEIDLAMIPVSKTNSRNPRDKKETRSFESMKNSPAMFQEPASSNKRNLSDKAKQDVGRWGEELVYNKMKQHYSKKYPGAVMTETTNGFILKGLDNQQKSLSLEIFWHNKRGESGQPRDFTIIKNGRERAIEVKSTPSSTKELIFVSMAELDQMHALKERYRFFRVYGAGTKMPSIEKMKNPSEKLELGEISIMRMELQL